MGKYLKRIFDFLFALIVIIPSFVVLLLGMILIKFISPEVSPIFKQKRIGYKGKYFVIYKLRSMTDERDKDGILLPDELRLKKWGEFIRKTNIDELFQVWNILLGEMSWIGPRPLLPKEMLVMTEDEQLERQSMRPGITGWEAVHEGESETRRQMAMLDLYYVRNWSLKLDFKVFYMTIGIIFGMMRPADSIRAPKLLDSEIISNNNIEGE